MYLHKRFKLLTLISSIALVIWLGFAYVEHQYEFDHHKHSEHHCEQFASAQHGLPPQITAPDFIPALQHKVLSESLSALGKHASVYRARSPPPS